MYVDRYLREKKTVVFLLFEFGEAYSGKSGFSP